MRLCELIYIKAEEQGLKPSKFRNGGISSYVHCCAYLPDKNGYLINISGLPKEYFNLMLDPDGRSLHCVKNHEVFVIAKDIMCYMMTSNYRWEIYSKEEYDRNLYLNYKYHTSPLWTRQEAGF